MSKPTPLHDLHLELGAKMVEFAGWHMPVSYPAGLIAEHTAARTAAALFDVSHMAQVELRGEGAAAALERLVPGGITSLKPGKARYTYLTTDRGGLIDDLIASHAGDHLYMVLNASRADVDIPHISAALPDGVSLKRREDLALLALQGPKAVAIAEALFPWANALSFMETATGEGCGAALRVSRLGYTGEDGFEISCPADDAARVADLIINAGAQPAGLGARDSLRMEAGLPLYGQDIDETTSPIAAGLGWAIPKRRREAGDFPGAEVILGDIAGGPAQCFTGILPDGRAPARAGTDIAAPSGEVIGRITSGGFSPTLGRPISMGYIAADHAAPDTPVSLIVRGKALPARTAALPFVPHNYKR